jgi:hypothetical protein
MSDCAGREPDDYFKNKVHVTNYTDSSSGAVGTVSVQIRGGPGFILLFLATLMKLYDVLCHMIVPTPPPKRDPVPNELSLEEYMQRNNESPE